MVGEIIVLALEGAEENSRRAFIVVYALKRPQATSG